jgi:hypothetical protein
MKSASLDCWRYPDRLFVADGTLRKFPSRGRNHREMKKGLPLTNHIHHDGFDPNSQRKSRSIFDCISMIDYWLWRGNQTMEPFSKAEVPLGS